MIVKGTQYYLIDTELNTVVLGPFELKKTALAELDDAKANHPDLYDCLVVGRGEMRLASKGRWTMEVTKV